MGEKGVHAIRGTQKGRLINLWTKGVDMQGMGNIMSRNIEARKNVMNFGI